MKLFTGWVLAAGLVCAGSAADAQMLSPYSRVSDVGGPYSEAPYGRPETPYGRPYSEAPYRAFAPASARSRSSAFSSVYSAGSGKLGTK